MGKMKGRGLSGNHPSTESNNSCFTIEKVHQYKPVTTRSKKNHLRIPKGAMPFESDQSLKITFATKALGILERSHTLGDLYSHHSHTRIAYKVNVLSNTVDLR